MPTEICVTMMYELLLLFDLDQLCRYGKKTSSLMKTLIISVSLQWMWYCCLRSVAASCWFSMVLFVMIVWIIITVIIKLQ